MDRWLIFVALATALSLAACARPELASADQLARGEVLYTLHCIQCHGNGEGNALNPPLLGSAKLRGQPSAIIRNILYGQQNESVVNGQKLGGIMPALDYLTDEEVADVATYVRSRFGNNSRPIHAAEVAAHRPDRSP